MKHITLLMLFISALQTLHGDLFALANGEETAE